MEALWLLAVGLVPVVFGPVEHLLFPDLPKVALVRIATGLIAMLWVLDWATRARGEPSPRVDSLWERLRTWLASSPSHPVMMAATVFLAAYLLSTLFSVSPRISLWGSNPGRDGYSTYNVVSYYVLFMAIAARVTTREQLWRLLSAMVLGGTVAAAYGLLQHFGVAPFTPSSETRVSSTFGNPLFAGAYFALVVPVTLGLGTAHVARTRSLLAGAGWSLVLGTQLAAAVFTLSRGPWVAVSVALLVLLALLWRVSGPRPATRSALVLVAALALVILVGAGVPSLTSEAGDDDGGSGVSPSDLGLGIVGDGSRTAAADTGDVTPSGGNPGGPTLPLEQLGSRAATIGTAVTTGGLSGRASIWRRSAAVIVERPWFEPETLGPVAVRHLFGYGPEMFLYSLPLRWEPEAAEPVNASAHNYVVQIAVEIGLLGMLAFIAFLVTIAWSAARLLARRRPGLSSDTGIVLVALSAALLGRVVEQSTGVARVSDTVMFWAVAGALTALLPMAHAELAGQAARGDSVQRKRRGAGPAQSNRLWRWVVAVAVIVMGIVVVWESNVPYVSAAYTGAASVKTLRNGDLPGALRLIDDAVETAPEVGYYYSARATMMEGFVAPDDASRREIALQQYDLRARALEANTLSHGATASLASSALELGVLGDRGRAGQAVFLYGRLTRMLPGYEPGYVGLAASHLTAGDPEAASEALEAFLDFTGQESGSTEGFVIVSRLIQQGLQLP